MPILDRPPLTREQRLFFLTFAFLVLLAPFYYQPNLGGEGLNLPYNSSIWIGGLLCMAAGLFAMLRRDTVVLPRYIGLLLIFPAGLIAGGFLTGIERPSEWLIRLGIICGGLLFWFSLFQFRATRQQVDNAIYLLISGLLIQAAVGGAQALPESQLAQSLPYVSNGVITGIYQQPNLHASMMATAIALVLYQVTTPVFSGARWPVRALMLLTLFLASFNLFSISSRVGLLGAIAAVALLALSRWRQFKRRWIFTLLMLVALGAGLTLGARSNSGTVQAFTKMERLSDEGVSRDARPHIYRVAWQTFLESPLLGHGIGSFQREFQQQRISYYQQQPEYVLDDKRFSHPHNEILFWLIEGGVLALASILCAVLAVVSQLFRIGWQRGGAYAALLIPITLHTQVELPFYISNVHWFVLLILLFICFQHGKRERPLIMSRAARLTATGTLMLAVPLLTLFLTHTQIANAGILQFMRSKGTELKHLRLALNNGYTREMGEFFWLRTLLYQDLKTGQTQNTETFIDWAKAFLHQTPDVQVHVDLARAYLHLQQREQALATMREARAIYPDNPKLKQAEQDILTGKPGVNSGTSTAAVQAPQPASPAQ